VRYTVVLDSCVIYPMPLCDTLLRLAEEGFYRPHFSQKILDDTTRNLCKNGRMTESNAKRYQNSILNTFPESLVEVPTNLINAMTNDPGDRHVLVCAVSCQADIIVTFNLKHFCEVDLVPWNVEAQHPDDFLLDLCDMYAVEKLVSIIEQQAKDMKKPPMSLLEVLERLYQQVPKFTQKITMYNYGYLEE